MVAKVYINKETAITWTDTTGDLAMTLNNLAAAAARQGAVKDWGTSARTNRYEWRCSIRFATAPVVGESIRLYLKTSDGTYPDNDDGTGDIKVSATDKLKNLVYLGSIIVDEAATGVDMVAHGLIEHDARYFMPVIHNNSADNLVATNNICKFIITPAPFEIQ